MSGSNLRWFIFRYSSIVGKIELASIQAVSGEAAERELREIVPYPRNLTLLYSADHYRPL
jgi:hypothetical protein